MTKPYNQFSDFIKDRFGCKVFKVTIDGGFTCPNKDGSKSYGGCAYCAPTALLPKAHENADVASALDAGIRYVRLRHKADKFIAYFQINTNTYAPLPYLRDLYAAAISHPDVAGIAVSTRPDVIDDNLLEMLRLFKEEKFLWLELGLQSANDATLARINRQHTAADFERACKAAASAGIDVCAHVIIGLPEECRRDYLATMDLLSRNNVWGVKFHQLQILRGTAFEQVYNRGGLAVLDLEEYAGFVVDCLEVLPESMIVHRLCGDAPQAFLIAPKWGVNKFVIIDTIMKTFRQRDTRQGARFGPRAALSGPGHSVEIK